MIKNLISIFQRSDKKVKIITLILLPIIVIFVAQLIINLIYLSVIFVVESILMLVLSVYITVIFVRIVVGIYVAEEFVKKNNVEYYPLSSFQEFPSFVVKNISMLIRKSRQIEDMKKNILKVINLIDSIGIIILNKERDIVFYNDFVRRFFKLTQGYIGKKLFSILPLTSFKISGFKDSKTYETEIMLEGQSRKIRICQKSSGNLTIIYFVDISEQKNMESITELTLSIISHELNTPITNLSLALENILLSRAFSEEVVSIALSNISRISNTISNIMSLSNIHSKKISINREWFSLKEIISSVLDNLVPSYQSKNIKVNTIYEGKEEIFEDREKIRLILFNITDNAFKFSPSGEEVRIQVRSEKGFEISISNVSSDLSDDELDKIFDKFYRASNSKGLRGSGLGLYIVKSLCDILGIKVEVVKQHNIIIFKLSKEEK
ncbi:MAG: ATP-binding protein [Spirochaetia bacterium]|nr:ATP-binding protein [Spirochaetota bacterium]MCX8096004.1 ATP-binding protein [Spirochaetota bacterium]MDW8111799.1 ATP-binding protein [Spirochaetia bacterium]